MWHIALGLALSCALTSAMFRGKEFLVAVLQNSEEAVRPNLFLHLTAYADSTQVTLTSTDGGSFHETINLRKDQTSPISIPGALELINRRISQKSLLVTSTKDISVVITSSKTYTVGATAVLPTAVLGNEYYVVTPTDAAKEGLKEFAVVAGKEPSTISIKIKGKLYFRGRNYRSGSTLSVPLRPYESLQLQSEDDLSGTKVTSDNAIAVFSGHTCAKVNSGCDYVVEQLLPVSAWGKAYIVPPNPLQKAHDFVYVVAAQDGSISYHEGSAATTKNVEAGEVKVFKLRPNSPFYVTSSVEIQVVLFFTGSRGYYVWQDPFLLTIPPISSYCASYRFTGLNAYNYVLLVAKNSDTNAIAQQKGSDREWKEIPGTEYSWSMHSLSSSYSSWSSENERATFGLLGFGFMNYVGYGFAGLCATSSSTLSCSDITCKERERCKMVEGGPTCVQETFSTCWVIGGPHYKTFDGKIFDFMGTCTYTLSKTCGTAANLPFFTVEVRNSLRGNAKSPYIDAVTVQAYNITVVVIRSENGFVRVNNHRTRLPISLAQGKFQLQQKGSFVLIKTDFMLKVLYNWDGHLMVKIPSSYSGQVCGMCGNSNGDPQDDALLPDGTLAQNAVVLGQVWKVLGDNRICLDSCSGECKRCSWRETAKYNTESYCGLLTQNPGPFQGCHDTIHTDIYLKNCISDLCSYEGLHTVLCQALNAYVESCQEEGVVLADWRTAARCFPFCPVNSNHTSCGTACPTTCNDAAVPSDCISSSCVEGCTCTEGFVLDAGKCIPKSECGCVFGDRLYGLGEEFWGDDGCTKRCVCEKERRKAVCHQASCRAKEECGVKDGIRGCYPTSYGVCTAVGSTHYRSFDGKWFAFQGTCFYQLVGLCKRSAGLVDFQVLVQNGLKDGGSPSFITIVRVKVYGNIITFNQTNPNKITVNDRSANLPYSHDGKILIYRGGRDVVIETDFGLTITYDWSGDVGVSVPSTYEDTLCGLCGNFNGDTGDDMMLKNGHVTSNPKTFGQSWKVADHPGCTELSTKECPSSVSTVEQEKLCGIISRKDGPFRGCHTTVEPSKYVQNCKNDLCLYPEHKEVLCQHIAHYVDLCQAAGVTIEEWRTNDFCRISCPAHSHYELCALDCSRTCSSIFAPLRCTERCREGCVCDEGFVFSGDECVPMARCGCLHHGSYYKVEEHFRPTELEECECHTDGMVDCHKIPAPTESSCQGVGEGHQCPTATSGTCVVTGDRSYLSFDGTAFDIPGACAYVLTESCSGDDDTEHFVVKIKKNSRQKTKVSGIEVLSVEVYGLTLTMERGKIGTIMVDSVFQGLPAILHQGQVQVHRHGEGIHLQTAFGLVVRYDFYHYVAVTAPPGYQGRLCGLCGNNNGKSEDDFLFPDGRPAPNAIAFGSAWKMPTMACEESCSEDDCPVCTEEKKKVFQKPNYCGILTDPHGPFSSCFNTVSPTLYLDACIRDLCLTKAKTDVLCRSIQSYMSSCQAAGVTIEAWRKPSFCFPRCPANSTYSLCSNLCTNSCAKPTGTSGCPQTCAEGCSCNEGFAFNGERCVPKEECGCFVDGIYYRPNQSVLKENCQQRCTCIPGKGLDCSSHECTDDETCEIRDGIMGCINQNPCKALGCRPRERCKLEDGQAKCVPSLVASCWAWGDPHYRTFDKRDFDFEGTCTYTMARFCGNDPTLVPFKVEGKNQIRNGVKSISYVSLTNVEVYGHRISIHWREVGKVRVDGVLTLLPAVLQDSRVHLYQSGMTAVLETDFGLRVTYDWNWHLMLELPSSYSEQICGLCGNFNLDPADDIPVQGDDGASSIISWASTWRVPDEDPFCWDFCDGECPVCEEEKRELYSGNQHCGLIKKSFQGPFKACHDVVSPQDFFRNCLYDVCMNDGARKILCKTLETYASTCRKHGAVVHDWRTPSGCSLPCPEHSHYEHCGSACPATCTNPDAPKSCSQPCVETCACDPGYVLSGGQCVLTSSCGCTHNGLYRAPGEEFWEDEMCRSRCRCDAALGMVVCSEGSCKAGEQCRVVRGVRQCVAAGRSICVATGDPHYTTFDGRRYDFMGTCVYQFAALCSADPTLVPFNVTVENNHRGSQVVSYTKEITLKVYNVTLSLSQAEPKKLKVNGIVVDLPFRHSPQLYAYSSGAYGFLQTDFGLIVTFDWYSYARVILPSTYARSVCGLCGNADGDPADDFALPGGRLVTDENAFANSWKVADVPGCNAECSGDCRVCTEAEKRIYRGDKHCGLLVKQTGPFANCHSVIDPAPYFEDCLFDVCLYKGHQEVVCRSISRYVTDCQSQRVNISAWRTAAFCSPVCSPNQHYELCGLSCSPSCSNQEEDDGCNPSSPCTEGCFCNPGYLQSGDSCVPAPQCGCLHDGRYLQRGEEFYPCERCSERCVCKGNGEVQCEPTSCGADEACMVQDGVRGCYPDGCGRCEELGAATFRTFDGVLLHFAGTCTYTLAAAEEGEEEEELEPFLVRVQKEMRGAEPLVRQLLVTVHGVTVSLRRGAHGEVKVDGERHLLPVSLASDAVTVTQEGIYRVLRTRGGLKLLYDGATYVLVTLPSSYQGHTGGLCGDFDGDVGNDVTEPQQLGEKWGIPTQGCNHGSQLTPCPQVGKSGCDILKDAEGPFRGCHAVVTPGDYVESCLKDTCRRQGGVQGRGDDAEDGGGSTALCRSLQAYAAACQAAGGELQEWREAAKCPLSCPVGAHPQLCSPLCSQSCTSLSSVPHCSTHCFEGCACPAGELLNGDECVTPDACGCLHRGRLFQIAETIMSADCSEICTCRAAGGMQCKPAGCPFGQVCTMDKGVRACKEQPGRCTLVPSSRFVSFDGTKGTTTAVGTYVVASICQPGHSHWFRLLGDVAEDEDRPLVVALHLFSRAAFVTVRRDKKVWVNGIPSTIPAQVSDQLSIRESQNVVSITQTPHLVVTLSPTGEVTVTVTKELSRELCGVCGDYDGDAANDLRGPDGKLVADFLAMTKAWRAPDFTP